MLKKALYEYLCASNLNSSRDFNHKEYLDQLLVQLDKHITTTPFNHRVLLYQPGIVPDCLHFVESGVVRGYITDDNHKKEKTNYLWFQNSLLGNANSRFYDLDSNLVFEVMRGTILCSISVSDLNELSQSFPCLNNVSRCLIESNKNSSSARLLNKSSNAWERLEELRRNTPEAEQLVSKGIIASFLGITPQHLSRIIREHIKKKPH